MMGYSAQWSLRARAQEDRFPLRGAACLAEPDEQERARLARTLRAMGLVVHETDRGAGAGFVAAQVRLEVMVMNLMLRDTRALTLIRQLRRANPELCLIAYTPPKFDLAAAGLELARVAGADAGLLGPVGAAALARAISATHAPVPEVTAHGAARA